MNWAAIISMCEFGGEIGAREGTLSLWLVVMKRYLNALNRCSKAGKISPSGR
ncbi:hypothetical protein ACLK19_03430 [Escherichia coli]